MKVYPRTRPIQRYITLDIHRKYVFAGGMNVGIRRALDEGAGQYL